MATKTSTAHSIRSTYCSFPNRQGAMISAYLDHPAPNRESRHFVVMSPKYGESKKNNLQLAYYLAANGFNVLRFDFTCHFGESEGDMLHFTLPGSAGDLAAAFDFLEQEHGVGEAVLIASSLSSLPAFRMAAEDRRVSHLVGVVPAVNFADSIARVYQEDLIGNYIEGRRYGVLDILGHDVNMDNFCASLVEANMHDLDGTLDSLRRVECPVTLLPAADDAWVAMEDVEKVSACNPRIEVCPIEGAMHEVRENRAAAEALTVKIIATCRRHCLGVDSGAKIAVPAKKVLFEQNRIERVRLRAARPVREEEDTFWGKYLGKYRVMEKTGDYQQYLDLVGGQLGELQDGDVLLDAGCGNGLFGVWVLRELIHRSKRDFSVPPLYVGIDLTEPGLRDAVEKHAVAGRMLTEPGLGAAKTSPPGLLYAQADLDVFSLQDASLEGMLRFQENCFDKIACSLLLSYLKCPERLVKTLYRLLRPGGRIVISSMKPFCDMSAIYRDFVEEKAAKEDIESARELLRAAGAIKIKQEQGYYEFFSDKELTGMLSHAGFKKARCFSSLGNQANVAVAVK